MKQSFLLLMSIVILTACSASTSESGNYSYRFLRQEVEVGNPKVFIYEVRIGENNYRELPVYAHNQKDCIYFIVDSMGETGKNSFEYKLKEYMDNFHNYYRGEKLTITSFDDAMDKAVSHYIQDNLITEPGK